MPTIFVKTKNQKRISFSSRQLIIRDVTFTALFTKNVHKHVYAHARALNSICASTAIYRESQTRGQNSKWFVCENLYMTLCLPECHFVYSFFQSLCFFACKNFHSRFYSDERTVRRLYLDMYRYENILLSRSAVTFKYLRVIIWLITKRKCAFSSNHKGIKII